MSQLLSEGVVDLFVLYKILKSLVTPFEKWEAFDLGVIDKTGKILIPKNKRTSKQKKSLTKFDLFILKIKKLLGKIPGGKSRIASYAAALWFLKEQKNLNSWEENEALNFLNENFVKEVEDLLAEKKSKLETLGTLVENTHAQYVTNYTSRSIGNKIGLDFTSLDLRTFKRALQIELQLRDDYNPFTPIHKVSNIEEIAKTIVQNLEEDPDYYVEEVPANNVGSGNVAMFDPVIKFKRRNSRKKKKALQKDE
jgi:hypothetical protein